MTGATEYTLNAVWIEKYKLAISASSITIDDASKSISIASAEPVYLANNEQITEYLASRVAEATKNDNDLLINKYFKGWNGSIITLTTDNFGGDKSLTITAEWGDKFAITITTKQGSAGRDGSAGAIPTYTVRLSINGSSEVSNKSVTDTVTTTKTFYAASGQYIKIEASNAKSQTALSSYTKITAATSVTITGNDGCVAAGTLITLADGTQKKVEDLVETDVLLVYDHENGEYVACPIMFIERDGWAYYNVINLKFSDGTLTRLIYEHALFDLTLNKYVYITEHNYLDYLGHEFVAVKDGVNVAVTLEEAYITNEYTGCYSLTTVYHLNYLIDGMLSFPGGIEGLFNFFEYDEDLKYDEEKMKDDIEKYGLYTYEDFAAYMPEEVYHMFQAQYFKISVEKGYMTFDDIVRLIERYLIGHGFV